MRIFLLVMLIVSASHCYAQIENGSVLAGVNLSFNHREYPGNNTYYQPDGSIEYRSYKITNSQADVSLSCGVFSNSSTLWGMEAGYYFNSSKADYTSGLSKSTSNTIYASPFTVKYFSIVDKWYVTLNISPYVGFSNGGDGSTVTTKTMTYRLGVSPGLSYMVNDHWIVSSGFGSLFYSFSKVKALYLPGDPVSTHHDYGVSLAANSFSMSISYLLK